MPLRRSFLFLQGPQSRFFRRLGRALTQAGHRVKKINFCGGDLVHWPWPGATPFRKSFLDWPAWAAGLMERERITDLVLFGDKRPMQHEAISIARLKGIRIYVLEEGYLQPSYVTVQRDGVNGRSRLPRDAAGIRELARSLPPVNDPPPIPSSMGIRVRHSYYHHIGNGLFFGLFPHYRTHRPYPILWELQGIYPRLFTKKKRVAWSRQRQEALLESGKPFFFFPLQLDSDIQIRQYSTFTGIPESIAEVLCSFAKAAPKDHLLAVKNHPVDNGLINYKKYVANMAAALGIADRIVYLEEADGSRIMRQSKAVALVNSSMGLEGLRMGKPVYCLGDAVYAFPGLAVTQRECPLDAFWSCPRPPDTELVEDFTKVLRHYALVRGNFYTRDGISAAIQGALERMEATPTRKAEEA